MSKRPRVPAALHSELSEYSSLLRALRTSNTLDLASQLTQPEPGSADHPQASPDVDEGESELPPSESVTPGPFSRETSVSVHASKRRRVSEKDKKRDTWTRWPLLAGDVLVPEWGLEDEVKQLALHVIKETRPSTSEVSRTSSLTDELTDVSEDGGITSPASSNDPTEDEDLLPPFVLSALTATSSTYLAQIFALLAAHVPMAERSLQNRLKPINWETVLDIAGAHGLVDANTALGVRRRLEQVYGPSQSHVEERIATTSTIHNRFVEAISAHEMSYLTQPGYEAPVKAARKRKRGPYKKRKSTADSEHTAPSREPTANEEP